MEIFFPVLESTTTTRALSGVGMARVKEEELLRVGYGNFLPVLESTTTMRALSGVGMARVKEEELLEVGYGNFLPASMRRQGAPRRAPP